jgi:DNA-3-methyladenine glycosylase I
MAPVAEGLIQEDDGRCSCRWHAGIPEYVAYHHREWGRPTADDTRLFEKICLEGFQSGLSWITILRKREAFRRGFAGFDAERVAEFGPADIERLVGDAGIVRHRGKIESVINNARRLAELRATEGSLAPFVWRHEPKPADRPRRLDLAALMAMPKTDESTALSKALRKRGWSFVGPTTIYAFMQAVGIVNDHIEGCWCRPECEAERAAFARPA